MQGEGEKITLVNCPELRQSRKAVNFLGPVQGFLYYFMYFSSLELLSASIPKDGHLLLSL